MNSGLSPADPTLVAALVVAGSKLTVWRLTAGAGAKVQVITVPMTYGSSS
jgi:hypothetical protein